ncbi:hypothetical protein MGYG_08082 [Nannizzia gypsea CBS 118893]|uniref:RRM domain-containing protein n=1 Tax=Arthroderma gypseum (strain ATCC MYA-4604 / CBS 118893) TaxID=535722 RepID=E4V4Z9_ARTGP|nr:hypothetical protein MGYG_08082 [Nannizzia gypsea CBS 118893]EFR05073.1 hypothetical protein MGYG_08082 [Nannizzia gypsea CBS 118893]
MAPNKKEESASFEAIIHNARLRRQKQALTDDFFGKARKSGAPGSNASSRRGSPVTGSLASRVEKVPLPRDPFNPRDQNRVASAGVKKQQAKPTTTRQTRESRLLSGVLPVIDKIDRTKARGPGLNIRGRASGPCVVTGSNFASGTTAEDIEAAFAPTGGDILQCIITKSYPSVTAQMVFAERRGADSVVAAFNSQKADGRVIQVRIDTTDPSTVLAQSNTASAAKTKSAFDSSRELADKERRENRRPADFQDGRFGFADPAEQPRQQQSNSYDSDTRNNNKNQNQNWGRNRRQNEKQHNSDKPDLYSDTMMVDSQSSHRNRRR